jgi:hypothetical protein
MFDVTTGQASQVAQHDAPIKKVGWVDAPGAGILATGSWDKTVKVKNSLTLCRLLSSLPYIGTSAVLGSPQCHSGGYSTTPRKMLYIRYPVSPTRCRNSRTSYPDIQPDEP